MPNQIPWVENLALQKIADTHAAQKDWLVLEHLGLTELPPTLAELTNCVNFMSSITCWKPSPQRSSH